MKLNLLKSASILSIALISGCSTIVNDKEQTVQILTSNGEQAEVMINGLPVVAPIAISLERKGNSIDITSTTEGCEATTLDVGISPFFWGNIITGGATGSTTDAASSKMWEYDDSVTIPCR